MDCSWSKQVEKQAIEEGIDKIFEEAGFNFVNQVAPHVWE